jgi:hypothetical protein
VWHKLRGVHQPNHLRHVRCWVILSDQPDVRGYMSERPIRRERHSLRRMHYRMRTLHQWHGLPAMHRGLCAYRERNMHTMWHELHHLHQQHHLRYLRERHLPF